MKNPAQWADNETVEFVSLIAGTQSFCIEITQIREIRRWTPVTALPYSEDSVLGIMNLRGAVIPIMDLAARLGLGTIAPSERHVVIVVALNNRTLGLLVDSVSEILSVKGNQIQETPSLGKKEENATLSGLLSIDDQMSRILNLNALIPDQSEEAA